MRNHLMASIATKNKSKDRSKNEQFHSRQQKTKDKHNISFKTKVVKIKLSKKTFSFEDGIYFKLIKFFNKIDERLTTENLSNNSFSKTKTVNEKLSNGEYRNKE